MTHQKIDLTEKILTKIKDLPLEQQQEILDFTEYIAPKYSQKLELINQPQKKRIAGLYKEKRWIRDD
ncbi:DUF2281 domain-containing protein [Geminocystis sp. CENA526]|uniref:DUF2281 domain-containing protein n=1 Tax=Geminocystis sp. CENA526 TaxID=1355871 RepID=UPI003D6FF0F5